MPCLKKFTTRGVYIHTVCLAHTHSAHACTYLNNFWTSTSVLPFLVGVACAFGLVVHVQWKCEPKVQESKKNGRAFVKRVQDLWLWLWLCLKTVMRFLCFTKHCSSLSYSSTLPQTSQHGSCSSLQSCLHFHFHGSLLFLPHSCHNFLTMRPLASAATALRTISLCNYTQFCVKMVF